jgi:hypothetical protein
MMCQSGAPGTADSIALHVRTVLKLFHPEAHEWAHAIQAWRTYVSNYAPNLSVRRR